MDDAKIVEVSLFGGKVLVTFADGMMALLELELIGRLKISRCDYAIFEPSLPSSRDDQ
jgi:hypothetical protein